MLILSRKTDESIVIGDEVTITILSVKGKQVRLGITAPPEISVHREEIYDRLHGGKTESSDASPDAVSEDEATGETGETGETDETDETDDDNFGNR